MDALGWTNYKVLRVPTERLIMKTKTLTTLSIVGGTLFTASILFGYPIYNVWTKKQSGKARLAEAKSSRQILVEEALAKKVSAKHYADAEVTRATGTAEAIGIVGAKLAEFPDYMKHNFINGLKDGKSEVIYIPTGNDAMPLMLQARRPVK